MMSTSDELLPAALRPGLVLQGGYRPTRELGRGPGSIVYHAEDLPRQTEVAIKVIPASAEGRAALRREALKAWELAHEHVVAIRGCFETGQACCIVMDYVAGPDLATRARAAPLTPDEAAAIGRGTALGLQAAHRRGLLHRNVKPSNILIGSEVRARLTDFGVSGLTGREHAPGRSDYLAPEVLAGQPADPRSDLYGLGLSLYVGLTGELPPRALPGRPPQPVADGYRPSRLRSAIPDWLDDAVAIATAALPADRFSSAGRLADALTPKTRRGVASVITVRV